MNKFAPTGLKHSGFGLGPGRGAANCLGRVVSAVAVALLVGEASADTNVLQFAPNPVVFDQGATNDNLVVLMAAASEHNSSLTLLYSGPSVYPKHFWFNNWSHGTNDYMKWNVALATGAVYHVYAKLSASANLPLQLSLTGSNAVLNMTTRDIGWDKLDAGTISIPAGTNQLVLRRNTTNTTDNISIISLELLRESDRPVYEQRIASFRADTTWLSQAWYGLMTQLGAWGYPPTGPQTSLEDFANGFNVPKFVNLVTNTGSKYVIWSLTWYTYQLCAPIQAVDRILGNSSRTSARDLVGELATALHGAGGRFVLYYHCGQDSQLGYNSTDWWEAQQFPEPDHTERGSGDRSTFFKNWCDVVSEIGNRYGTNLDGWCFDDGMVYYPAPFERLGQAAKAGNPNRLVSYNSWIASSYTDFEDWWMGEGSHGEDQFGSAKVGGNGIFTDGPHKGILQHGMFMMEQDWGVYQPNQPITTQVSASQAIRWVQNASARGVPLSFNMMMWADQTYSTDSLLALVRLKNAVYGGATNLLVNGGFESPVLASWTPYPAGSTDIAGWTVDATPSDGVQLGIAGILAANNGSQNLQLTGGGNGGNTYAVGGGISQTIATTPGKLYAISIDVAARSGAATTGTFRFGSSNYLLNASSSTFSTVTWRATATESNTVIDITGDPNSLSRQLVIDNVSVRAGTPPSILLHPQSSTKQTGSSATFTVVADGADPLSYQWYFNTHTPVAAGTNATLVLTNVQSGAAGVYNVVVTNSYGAATSEVAGLTVLLNLVVNGDFENPTASYYMTFLPGSTALPGWAVDTTPPDGLQLGRAGLFANNNGSQNLQLTGGTTYSVGGGLSQTIATTPGATYAVSIDVASRQGGSAIGNFEFGGTNLTVSANSTSFTTLTSQVVATGSNTVLDITGNPNSASQQLVIDNVVVVPTAPVAPSLLGVGLLPGGAFQLSFSGPPGQPYRVLATNSIVSGPLASWPAVMTGVFGAGGPVSTNFIDWSVATQKQQFYVIVSP